MTDRELLERIDRRLGELLEAAQGRQASVSRADRALLERLLPVIVGAVGSRWRTTRELCGVASMSPKALGRLLMRATGEQIDGYVVERGGIEHNATLWRIVARVVSDG